MSFIDQVESDFQAIVASAESTVQKLESFVGLRNRVTERQTLEAQLTAIIDDGSKATPDKVQDILVIFGKA